MNRMSCLRSLVSGLSTQVILCSLRHDGLFLLTERSSVQHYSESACASHATNTVFCLGKQIWEFLPRAANKESNLLQRMAQL